MEETARVIGFYGYSASGKTSIIEKIVLMLKEKGFKVAVIKQSDRAAPIDTPGKDTYRFAQAGAGAVALTSHDQTAFFIHEEMEIQTIIRTLQSIHQPDMILVEGARDKAIDKIRMGNKEERENTIWTYDGDLKKLMKIILKEE